MNKEKEHSVNGMAVLLMVLVNLLIIRLGDAVNENWYWLFLFSVPLLLLSLLNATQQRHAMPRNLPVKGYLRYLMDRPFGEYRKNRQDAYDPKNKITIKLIKNEKNKFKPGADL